MSFKKRQVVMLPTNEKAKTGEYLVLNKENKLCIWNTHKMGVQNTLPIQHLYILSDEEIKEGDWFLMNGCIIRQCKSTNNEPHTIPTIIDTTGGIHHVSVCKKIIATTDKSLENWRIAFTGIPPKKSKVKFPNEQLPQPSQSFIEKYVEEYNKGNQIVDITLEYENSIIDGMPVVKVSLKDNTVTIRKMKDSWNREEVIKLLNGFEKLCYLYQANKDWFPAKKTKWIEENL